MGYNGGSNNGGVDWSYYDKFDAIEDKYLPRRGEGDTMAEQIVTAITKLVYKWYNDGDVFDNTYHMEGWCNDLSTYANWLFKYADGCKPILNEIVDCRSHADYENLLKDLTDLTYNEEYLNKYNTIEKEDSIYTCEGVFEFREDYDENDDDYDDDYDDYWD